MIQNFPLPPSENDLYRNVPRVGRVATKALKDYRNEVAKWAFANVKLRELFDQIRKDDWNSAQTFKVDFYFVMKHERIWTKDNRPKRIDASNRVKAAQDQLCAFLGIDDKLVWNTMAEKVSGDRECVIIFISPITPITSVELLSQFSQNKEKSEIEQ